MQDGWPGWTWIDAPLHSGRLQVRFGLLGEREAVAAALCALVLGGLLARPTRDGDRPAAWAAAAWAAGAVVLLLADNLALAFAGWAGMGLAAATLVPSTPGSWARARLAEACFMIALAMAVATAGTFDFAELIGRAARLGRPRLMGPPTLWGASAAVVVCGPLVAAVMLRAIDLGRVLGERSWSSRRPSLRAWLTSAGAAAAAAMLLLRLRPVLDVVPGLTGVAIGACAGGLVWGGLLARSRVIDVVVRCSRRAAALCRDVREIDREVIAGAAQGLPGMLLSGSAWLLAWLWSAARVRRVVTGLLALWLCWWAIAPHPTMDRVEPVGPLAQDEPADRMAVALAAAPGPGYQYLWDFDSDGAADTGWQDDPAAAHSFDDSELAAGVIAVLEPGAYGRPLRRVRLRPGERMRLDPADLGPLWRSRRDRSMLPFIVATSAGLHVRINDARVRRGFEPVPREVRSLELSRGESISFGTARLSVTGVAEPTLYVRNALGLVRSHRGAFELPEVSERPAADVGGVVGEGKGEAP